MICDKYNGVFRPFSSSVGSWRWGRGSNGLRIVLMARNDPQSGQKEPNRFLGGNIPFGFDVDEKLQKNEKEQSVVRLSLKRRMATEKDH